MSWLRLDDAFASHRKIAKLTDREFRVWVRVLCHCARYDSGHIDEHSEVKGLSDKTIAKYLGLGLLEPAEHDHGYQVHDWILYTGAPVAAKVAYYLSRNPDAPANEIVKACGARRKEVLDEIRKQRPDGSPEPDGNRDRTSSPQAESGSPEPHPVVPSRPDQRTTTKPEAVTRPAASADQQERPSDFTHIQTLISESLREAAA